jgi:hypothetical protein
MKTIKHSFDIWHFIKAVIKDIFAASKQKKCVTLGDWIPSIKNMMWYSFAECNGNPELLEEMLLSIPHHLANVHVFPENKLFTRCLHGDLDPDRDKPWLKVKSSFSSMDSLMRFMTSVVDPDSDKDC